MQEMNVGNKFYLINIEQIDEDSNIKVQVLKMWNFIKNNTVLSIEMIIMDEESTKYHYSVFIQYFARFGDLLKEDQTYIILKPNMAIVNNGFNATGPVNGFVFVDFNSIIEQTCPRDAFFDVIGQIATFRAFVHLKVTIFGTQAYQMSRYLKTNPKVICVVIVMQFVKLHIWDALNWFSQKLKADDNGDMSEKSITTLPSYSSSYTDQTLKDVLRCRNSSISNIPFGGKIKKNMRLTVGRDLSDMEKIRDFANWLLDIRESKLGGPNDGETIIDIPDDILINDPDDPIGPLIEFVYPLILEKYSSTNYLQEIAILAPKNEIVQEINERLLKKFPGDEFDANLYSPDVLNGLKVSDITNHKLVLKIGVPVMLLRNIDKKNGLCNGTRLQAISLGKHVIEARIISGTNIGNHTFIPRMPLTPSEKNSFKFTRRQFLLAVCFAMTINKSQRQSLSNVGLFLKDPYKF
uniref:DNA helicase Pif1-like 2B domain-containing protein n=1 Tax=Lactuca sativa TaxID=4236 RepID=A0A9R1UFG7_LACSA|nr:hypothetical protein LSAT_V11C900478180 [Lactuca sativa]